ncbi:hypothetical protein D3C75_736120 [compost metagenome]
MPLFPTPEVITTLANQAHIQARNRQFFTFCIGIDNVKTRAGIFVDDRLSTGAIGAVIINFFTGKLRANPRQRFGRPDCLLRTSRDWATTGFQQTCLQHQAQWGVNVIPLAVCAYGRFTLLIKLKLYFVQIPGEVFFVNITKLEPRQRSNRFTQWTQEQLTLQIIPGSRRAI